MASEQHAYSPRNCRLHEEAVACAVKRRDKELEIGSAVLELECWNHRAPVHEFTLRVDEVVQTVAPPGNAHDRLQSLPHEIVELVPTGNVDASPHSPHVRKCKERVDLRLDLKQRLGEVKAPVGNKRLEILRDGGDEIDVDGGHKLLCLCPDKIEARVAVRGEEREDVVEHLLLQDDFTVLLRENPPERLQPGLHGGLPTDLIEGYVNHAAPADCRWRCHGEVLNLEEHAHGDWVQLDPFSVG